MAERCSAIRGESLGLDKSHRDSWRHPHDPCIVVSRKFAAVIALMQMGISDFQLIAEAVDLGVDVVKRIDEAEDLAVRSLALIGIPNGEFFKLRVNVHCPRCNGRIHVAPRVLCAQRAAG